MKQLTTPERFALALLVLALWVAMLATINRSVTATIQEHNSERVLPAN